MRVIIDCKLFPPYSSPCNWQEILVGRYQPRPWQPSHRSGRPVGTRFSGVETWGKWGGGDWKGGEWERNGFGREVIREGRWLGNGGDWGWEVIEEGRWLGGKRLGREVNGNGSDWEGRWMGMEAIGEEYDWKWRWLGKGGGLGREVIWETRWLEGRRLGREVIGKGCDCEREVTGKGGDRGRDVIGKEDDWGRVVNGKWDDLEERWLRWEVGNWGDYGMEVIGEMRWLGMEGD